MLRGILSAGRVVCRACLSTVSLIAGAVLGSFSGFPVEPLLGMLLVGLCFERVRGAAFQLELWCLIVKVLLSVACAPALCV